MSMDKLHRSLYLLDVPHGLLHIIEVCVLSPLANLLSLPIGKCIRHKQLHTTLDQRVRCTICILVPAIRCADQSIGKDS